MNDTTDVFTSTAHGLTEGAEIQFTGGTLPAPLQEGQVYFLRDQTANTFKVATTRNGTAINITSTGSGTLKVKLANGVISDSWGAKATYDNTIGDPGTIPYDDPDDPINQGLFSLDVDPETGSDPLDVHFTLTGPELIVSVDVVYGNGNTYSNTVNDYTETFSNNYSGVDTYDGYVTVTYSPASSGGDKTEVIYFSVEVT